MSDHENDIPWGVVHTRPYKELLAASLLEQSLGLEVYLPEVMRERRGVRKPTPFFPGYLFVRSRLAALEVTRINRTPGVIRLLTWKEAPQTIPAAVIETLRARVDAINGQGGLPSHPYRTGDRVLLIDGPLEGLEAVFQGPMTPSQRVTVLLTFLGQLQEVEVEVEHLEPAPPPPPRPPRRTRGKGRRIRKRT